MARPERTRNSSVRFPMVPRPVWAPVRNTIPQEKASTITVRIAVATVESVRRMPHFAKTAVSPAKNAEANAKSIHIKTPSL